MLEAFISGFWQTVAWPAFGYMLIGIAIGFLVGLLPGIGGLATLALMLPFSYSIKDPISAFAFLPRHARRHQHHRRFNLDTFRDPRGGVLSRLDTRRLSHDEKWRSRPRLGCRDHGLCARRGHRRALSWPIDPDHAPAGAPLRLAGAIYHRDHGHHLHRHLGRPIA